MISYKPLEILMIKLGYTRKTLCKLADISPQVFYNISIGKDITTTSLNKLCKVLNCQPCDLVEFVKGEKASFSPTRKFICSNEKLERQAEKCGFSLWQLSQDTDISFQAIQNARNGKVVFISTVVRLCNMLDCSPEDIGEYVEV